MGNPRGPEACDMVTLVDGDGVARGFMVVYADEEVVVCSSASRTARFTRGEFEALFEEGGGR